MISPKNISDFPAKNKKEGCPVKPSSFLIKLLKLYPRLYFKQRVTTPFSDLLSLMTVYCFL